jgi:predicted RNase H-like nuclease (RuvC/YqgF family)
MPTSFGRLRERPRVALAQALAIGLIALAAGGAALLAFDDGEGGQDQAAELERAERANAAQTRELDEARAGVAELERRTTRLERRVRTLSRRNQALRRDLAQARRALRAEAE